MFHFSGHGCQVPIQDYSVENYEVEKYNQAWCPVDFNWDGTYILDNKINKILGKMKKEHHMTMISDSCFSGSIDKAFKQNDRLAKTMPTPLDLMSRIEGVELSVEAALGISLDDAFGVSKKENNKKVNIKKAKVFSEHNISILTGSTDTTTSADAYFVNRYQGALSYYMQGILMRNLNISAKDLRDGCARLLKQNGFTQVPQLIASEENVNKPFIQV